MKALDGILFARMINSGAASLGAQAARINELNVFPIPDGDTGDNMLFTMMGGVCRDGARSDVLEEEARRVSGGMLLSARGNSGVILSQFFEGIKNGFSGLRTADATAIGEAFRRGVAQAYGAVMAPAEGTILTVVREATEYACRQGTDTPEGFLQAFLDEARRSLARTPELLPVLKQAGVVDSGAAGLICIAEGMLQAALGEEVDEGMGQEKRTAALDLDAFGEDSVLEFGYCTELLIRLQNAKTDISAFDVKGVADYLQTLGDSVVAVKNGSIVKLHVHTMTPGRVLTYCQQYGEFLTVKIENMSLQHNSTVTERESAPSVGERKKYGVVAVASGEGLKQAFRDRGADVVVDGGQSMNPSAEDFIAAFDTVNAEVIFVFPNNGNVVLAARQAAQLYGRADIRVIESRTIGAGYASLAMLDTGSGDTDALEEELCLAMEGVITAEICRCVRDARIGETALGKGEYIGIVGKELLAVGRERLGTVCETLDRIGLADHDVCILVCGKDAPDWEAERIESYITSHYRGKEVYTVKGGQDVYDYILIVE